VLINLSHVIINSTLARAENQTIVLAGYALAMSLLGMTERPSILLRQTSSALVRDRVSFRAVRTVGMAVFGATLIFGALVAYTPFGYGVFSAVFGADPEVAGQAVAAWKALMFLSALSGLRCLFQGVIIYRMRTKWMTIGMIFRLAGMYALSLYFIQAGIASALQGSIIFVFGMLIEATVSGLEFRRIRRTMPERDPDHEIVRPRQVLPFYRPLLLSSFVVIWVTPVLNTMLGQTWQATLSIASFAVATSLMNLLLGFFTYFHQIALQFGNTAPAQVRRFILTLGFVPGLVLALISFTAAGPWMLANLLGVQGELLDASLHALRGFLPYVLLFPWLDSLNGFVMGQGDTKLMFASQTANTVTTLLVIILLVFALPQWHGVLGSLAQSVGVAAELSLLYFLFMRSRRLRLNPVVSGPSFTKSASDRSKNLET
jgi:flagellar biosynthesis protein FliQ